jgi:predicted nucleic acid-binding protein
MKKYVVDASVILKWVLEEDEASDKEKAFELLNTWAEDRIRIYSPLIWQYEVGNFLGRELPSEAEQKMALLLDLHIGKVTFDEKIYRRCFAWMKGGKLTFYEAVYLSSAYEIQGVLITADEQLAKKIGKNDCLCLLKQLL